MLVNFQKKAFTLDLWEFKMTSPVRTWVKEEFVGIGLGGKRLNAHAISIIEKVARALAVYDVIIWRLTWLIQVLAELPDHDLGPGSYV
jgi:hypothetical protein